ncbi:hypothetical protein NM208_g6283 [Fusarium decemcellulare]|uniref:Uncharacterized protein n=2 Tax=Fusarium decemcellulare TaxID=57161 RepID=A0ACC1SE18_9HYPO|nr:hypothetical protein NM208_g6499 [Fusarium decemcellulare]KAJ3537510.1 hypothetical protein NM208_g6283 [Fusarium decemcellulare]
MANPYRTPDLRLVSDSLKIISTEIDLCQDLPAFDHGVRILDAIQGLRTDFNAKTDILTANVHTLTVKVDTLTTKVDGLENRMGSLENKVTRLDNRVGNLEKKVGRLENKVEGLENKVERLDNRVERLDNRVGSLDDKVERVETGQANLSAELGQLRQQVDGLGHSILISQKNVTIRLANSTATRDESVLYPLRNMETGQEMRPFPQTIGHLNHWSGRSIDHLLSELDEATDGDLAEKRNRILLTVGVTTRNLVENRRIGQ